MGPHPVRSGQKAYVIDQAAVTGAWSGAKESNGSPEVFRDVTLRFSLSADSDNLSQALTGVSDSDREFSALAYESNFGARITSHKEAPAIHSPEVYLFHPKKNPFGCQSYGVDAILPREVVVIRRGKCTFVEKLRQANIGGAAGVIVVSDGEIPLNPTAGDDDVQDLTNTPLVVVTQSTGKQIFDMMDLAREHETQVMLSIESELGASPSASAPKEIRDSELKDMAPKQYLILGGRPILNLLIMV